MARRVGVFALIFVAIVGLVSAQNHKAPASAPVPTIPATTPTANAPKPTTPPSSAPVPTTSKAAAPTNASPPTPTSTATPPTAAAPTMSTTNNDTNNVTMPDVALPAPVGSETKVEAPSESSASSLEVSAVVAGVMVAGFFY